MQFPNALEPAGFLAGYWQKQPLFIGDGFDVGMPVLDPDELAWLAMQQDVESRLIFTDRKNGECSYRVEHGPFDDQTLSQLPDYDWTLLVQDVEKHLPDFRAYFAPVRFVPDWRIDDLMVSLAAPGGSVGPHADNYDVFLCQGRGQREWRLARRGSIAASSLSAELSLLQPFVGEQNWLARQNDVLYLPPGVPHWGIAADLCMTYSIGMRAPKLVEFIATFERLFENQPSEGIALADTNAFYEDPDLTANEGRPGLISERALARVRNCFEIQAAVSARQLAAAFGSLITDPKAWLAPETTGNKVARKTLDRLHAGYKLQMHGMARVAYTAPAQGSLVPPLLFANGFYREIDPALVDFVAEFCNLRAVEGHGCKPGISSTGVRKLLEWLITRGVFDLADE